MSGYAVAHLEEIPELDDGRAPYRPVRHHFGLTAFGVNAWTGHKTGDRIINEHDEDEDGGHEELYVVIAGRATFELGGESVDAPEGTFVSVEPGVSRTAFAAEPGTTILALGGVPGEPYQPVGWELWAPVNKFYMAGLYEEAAARGRRLLDEGGDAYPEILYNVACCESLAGRQADAIEHLGRAIERADRLRAIAAGDSDFAPLRDEPGFRALVGGAE